MRQKGKESRGMWSVSANLMPVLGKMHTLLIACYSGGSEAIKPLDPESPGCSTEEHTHRGSERLQGSAAHAIHS